MAAGLFVFLSNITAEDGIVGKTVCSWETFVESLMLNNVRVTVRLFLTARIKYSHPRVSCWTTKRQQSKTRIDIKRKLNTIDS